MRLIIRLLIYTRFLFFFIFFQIIIMFQGIGTTYDKYIMVRDGTHEILVLKYPTEALLVKRVNPVRGDVYIDFLVKEHQYKSFDCNGVLHDRPTINICKLVLDPKNLILEIHVDLRVNEQKDDKNYQIRSIIYEDINKVKKTLTIKRTTYSKNKLLSQYKSKLIFYVLFDSLFISLALIIFYFFRYRHHHDKFNKFFSNVYFISKTIFMIGMVIQLVWIWKLLLSL